MYKTFYTRIFFLICKRIKKSVFKYTLVSKTIVLLNLRVEHLSWILVFGRGLHSSRLLASRTSPSEALFTVIQIVLIPLNFTLIICIGWSSISGSLLVSNDGGPSLTSNFVLVSSHLHDNWNC